MVIYALIHFIQTHSTTSYHGVWKKNNYLKWEEFLFLHFLSRFFFLVIFSSCNSEFHWIEFAIRCFFFCVNLLNIEKVNAYTHIRMYVFFAHIHALMVIQQSKFSIHLYILYWWSIYVRSGGGGGALIPMEWWMCDRYCFVKFNFQPGWSSLNWKP